MIVHFGGSIWLCWHALVLYLLMVIMRGARWFEFTTCPLSLSVFRSRSRSLSCFFFLFYLLWKRAQCQKSKRVIQFFTIREIERKRAAHTSNPKRCLDINAMFVCDKTIFMCKSVCRRMSPSFNDAWIAFRMFGMYFFSAHRKHFDILGRLWFYWRFRFLGSFLSLIRYVLFGFFFLPFQSFFFCFIFFRNQKSIPHVHKLRNSISWNSVFCFRKLNWLIELTYCPSNVIGGVTGHCWNVLLLLTSTIHRWTSGFFDPGVGYRIVRVSGNDVLPKLCTAIRLPESNHG